MAQRPSKHGPGRMQMSRRSGHPAVQCLMADYAMLEMHDVQLTVSFQLSVLLQAG